MEQPKNTNDTHNAASAFTDDAINQQQLLQQFCQVSTEQRQHFLSFCIASQNLRDRIHKRPFQANQNFLNKFQQNRMAIEAENTTPTIPIVKKRTSYIWDIALAASVCFAVILTLQYTANNTEGQIEASVERADASNQSTIPERLKQMSPGTSMVSHQSIQILENQEQIKEAKETIKKPN